MKYIKKNVIFFSCGGVGYGLLEILWRGRTHWSMLLAGGICSVLFSQIAQRFRRRSRLYKAALCAVGVTAVELVFGVVFNMILKMKVWDYSRVPLNFLGQICPLYTLLWGCLGFVLIPVADRLNKQLLK